MNDRQKQPVGLYLHIPFCRSKCPYCDFCSFPHPGPDTVDAYVTELTRRIGEAGRTVTRPVDTVYIGGGTPTLLTPAQAERLTDAVRAAFRILPDAEFTVEGNPATVTEEKLAAWVRGGVNRLSLGAQSAHAAELKSLGRLHTWQDVTETVTLARAAGIDNINLDFMLAIPGQTPDSLRETLEAALSLSPDHLSAYCLIIEEGTPFARRGRRGLGLPEDDDAADELAASLYEQASAALTAAGYEHYEISNYAKPGRRSQHNLHTWQDREYLGLGPGAYSYMNGVRYGQSRDLPAFLRGCDITVDRYVPDDSEKQEEYIMLGLRLREGISEADFAARFGCEFRSLHGDRCAEFVSHGLMEMKDGRVRLTEKGWLLSNSILSELI